MIANEGARGEEFKRVVRAAAALRGIYSDADLARAVGVSRMAVAGWWSGAKPDAASVRAISSVTGLDELEVHRYVNFEDEPVPNLVQPESAASEAVAEGLRRDRDGRPPEARRGRER